MRSPADPGSQPAAGGNGDDGTPGFGIYVHWPFCAAKCPYCDFNSHVRHQPVDQSAFAAGLQREIDHMRARTGPRIVTSVFFGGGTPSLMEPPIVGQVLDAIDAAWGLPGAIEITLEANPASSDAARFAGYRSAGVNRVSLGVQALNDADLRFLGRLHSVDEALAAIDLAQSRFDRMSFDLIYARPGQTPDTWEAELRRAVALAADHLSLYQLTIEEGTPFRALFEAGKLVVPDDDLAADLFTLTRAVTHDLGFDAYEVSNHARPGAQSRHNLTYWRYGDYVGIGPGAHGRFADLQGAKRATSALRHPETWLKQVGETGHGLEEDAVLMRDEQANEMLLMGLRLGEGLDLARLQQTTGHSLDPGRLQAMVDLAMIEPVGNARIRATARGQLVLNSVIAELAV